MADFERPQFLRTPPVHFHFLRELDELEASSPPQRAGEEPSTSLPYNEERGTWHKNPAR